MTWQWDPQVERLLEAVGDARLVVDLGAGGRRIAPHVKTVDVVPHPGTDYVVDVCTSRTPFADGSVDLVLCTGVLEHVQDDVALMTEINRICRPGGLVHIESAFLQHYHEDERRMTLPGLRRFVERFGFRVVKSGNHIGPTVTVLTLVTRYVDLVLGGSSRLPAKLVSNAVTMVLSWALYPLKFVDGIVGRKARAHELAFGIYVTARKPG